MKGGRKAFRRIRVRENRSYTFRELARLYGVHVRSIQNLKKQGMGILNPDERPYLVLGSEVRRFLKHRSSAKRVFLKPYEFRCPRCKAPVRSREEAFWIDATGRLLGPHSRQILLRGACGTCDANLVRFSSDRELKRWQAGTAILEKQTTLKGGEGCSMNTDKGGLTENDETESEK